MLDLISQGRRQNGKAKRLLPAPPAINMPIDTGPRAEVPVWALVARDAQVTELAIKVDRLQRQLETANSELSLVRQSLAQALDEADLMRRREVLIETQNRMRLEKQDGTLRLVREVKQRLDAIEARRGGNYHGYATFEAVSIRLTELGELEKKMSVLARRQASSVALACAGAVGVGTDSASDLVLTGNGPT